MREILFRGKRTDNGEWVCGNLTVWSDRSASIDQEPTEASPLYAVDPKTVGQYTGLTDKNGKKVFEGDIVAYKYGDNKVAYIKVEYDCVFGLFLPFGDSDSALETKEVEVVGNVFDTPELLEVK